MDEAARRSGVSRGQSFDDFLEMAVCTLSGGRMEPQYLAVVKKYSEGAKGKRGVDSLAELYGKAINAMEDTRDDIKDVLGDLFVGGISYGEDSQYFTPMPICQMMARLTIGDMPEDEQAKKKTVCDPACGSGRMLLAVAEVHRHWEFVGQDVDLRCCRLTALNLALRNLYGYAICGNSLGSTVRQVYRTGFNGRGFLREASHAELQERFGAKIDELKTAVAVEPTPHTAEQPSVASSETAETSASRGSQIADPVCESKPLKQLRFF